MNYTLPVPAIRYCWSITLMWTAFSVLRAKTTWKSAHRHGSKCSTRPWTTRTLCMQSNPPLIGIFGESLGAYLALNLAMRDPRVKSVSEYAGGLRLEAGDDPRRLPPTLIQHGSADSIVSVQEAFHLEGVLTSNGIPHQMRIYEGLNHYPDLVYRKKMEQLTIHFFDETLKNRIAQPLSLSPPQH